MDKDRAIRQKQEIRFLADTEKAAQAHRRRPPTDGCHSFREVLEEFFRRALTVV
jgi:hypothetical protein